MIAPNQIQPRTSRRRVWIITTIAVILALGVGTVGGYFLFLTHPNALLLRRTPASATILHNEVPPQAKQATDNGALDPNMTLPLSITLPMSYTNKLRLQAFLKTVYDPASPFYHQFLTPQEYQQQYGLPADTIKNIKDYLALSGVDASSISISPTGQLIDLKASVGTIEKVFNVQLHKYTLHGQTYYGPVSDPHVPTALAGLIQSISGLDDFSVYHSGAQLRPHASNGYTPADLQKAYDASGLLSKGIDGSGQNIAFMELDGYQSSDIQQYQQQYGVTGGTFETVSVDGANYDSNPGQGSVEVQLDMEVAFAMAPKIHELVYEGQNSGQGINDIYSQIVNDDKAKIVSVSWGLCEQSSGSSELQALDQIFQQGAAEGIAFFAAAGDNGAYDCGDNTVNVDSPADDPYVTGVGGTSLTLNNGAYGSETAWSCASCTNNGQNQNGSGGGGGISQAFPVPSFQQNVHPSGTNGQTGRYVPDVSADADPNTGYSIICSASCGGNGQTVVGGTSAAAPLWASGMALIEQSLAKAGKTLGNANSAIYALAGKGIHDVTQGDNLLYQAGPGYDLATGWGSADFAALAAALASGSTGTPPPAPNPTPTPGGNPTPTPGSGNGGGTPTPNPPPTSGNGQELLSNGGFENGTSPWSESSSGGYELITTDHPHSGQYSALLCGYSDCQDIIAQGFQLPSSVSSVTLSYWWDMQTDKSGACADHFTVGIYAVNSDYTLGSQVAQVQDVCNDAANGKYQQQTVDLSSALQGQAGQVLAIVFSGTTDSQSNTTETYVDDVSLQAQ
jgi:hypothetical protein